jgi:hypothetical protein
MRTTRDWNFILLGLLLAACATSSSATTPAAPGTDADPDVKAIAAMLGAFQRALVGHDGPALLAMMASPDTAFRSRQVDNGQLYTSTAGEFAGAVSGAKETWEERFAHVAITARDGLAVLDADYQFAVNNRITNHGREVWTLLRAPDGWKITMVTWSIIPDPAH